ncbi:hypothetical protein ABK040_008810 [Willaertia magna]
MLAEEELCLSKDLLEFYKHKIAEYEKEREDFIRKFGELQVDYKRFHEQEWELRRREEEIDALRRALSDAQLHIFDEREHSMHLQHENDALRVQEMEDRKKIRDLLALTQPVNQEITYFKDCRPDQMTRYALNTKTNKIQCNSINSSINNREDRDEICIEDYVRGVESPGKIQTNDPKLTRTRVKSNNPTSTPSRILRTIFMPNEKTDTLVLQIESLRAQLQEVKTLSTEKEEALLRERKLLIDEENKRRERDKTSIERLQKELQDYQKKLSTANREYFVMSHNLKLELRKQAELMEKIKQENVILKQQSEKLKERTQIETQMILEHAREQTEEYAKHFREQTIMKENDILHLQDKMAASKEEYNTKMKLMEDKVAKLQKKYKDLIKRRSLDVEGFNSDVLILRKKLSSLQRKLKSQL